jgi:hypothetical protein
MKAAPALDYVTINICQALERGVNYRALDDLFQLVAERSATMKYTVSVSVLEIYNESCRDLLAGRGDAKLEILATVRPTSYTRHLI